MSDLAYLVELSNGDVEIVSVDEYDENTWHDYDDATIEATLELVASFDHGVRTSEELVADLITATAELTIGTVLRLIGATRTSAGLEAWNAVCAQFSLEQSPYSGLWHVDDADELWSMIDSWEYEFRPMLEECGFIVDESGDAGMTWLYAPVHEETSR